MVADLSTLNPSLSTPFDKISTPKFVDGVKKAILSTPKQILSNQIKRAPTMFGALNHYFVAASNATSIMSLNVVWRSSDVVSSPVKMWSLTVRTDNALRLYLAANV